MKVVEEIRRIRLLQLRKEFGSYAKLNEKLGRSSTDATLSQIANQAADSKTGRPRAMGSPQARALEQACGKEVGWMDTDPDLLEQLEFSPAVAELAAELEALEPEDRDNLIQLFQNTISMTRRDHQPPPEDGPVVHLPTRRRSS
jgi:hypothetical protein